MNRIQSISRDLQTEQLKQRLGLDPAQDIDSETVRQLWNSHQLEQLKTRLGARFSTARPANDDA